MLIEFTWIRVGDANNIKIKLFIWVDCPHKVRSNIRQFIKMHSTNLCIHLYFPKIQFTQTERVQVYHPRELRDSIRLPKVLSTALFHKCAISKWECDFKIGLSTCIETTKDVRNSIHPHKDELIIKFCKNYYRSYSMTRNSPRSGR